MKKRWQCFLGASLSVIVVGSVSFAENKSELLKIPMSQYPQMELVPTDQFALKAMKGELPKTDLERVIDSPQFVKADINFDGIEDFIALLHKPGLNNEKSVLQVVGCLQADKGGFQCLTLDTLKLRQAPYFEYLDVFTVTNGDCGPSFPDGQKTVALMPILGCCFTVYRVLSGKNRVEKCSLGD